VEPAISEVQRKIPPGFPVDVSDAIFRGLRDSAERLAAQPKS
jgi:hypothetical protein